MDEVNNKATAIVSKMAEFGSKMIAAAKEDLEDQTRKVVIRRVQQILVNKQKVDTGILAMQRQSATLAAQLDALNKGEFDCDRLTGNIIFKNPDLNQLDQYHPTDPHGNPLY